MINPKEFKEAFNAAFLVHRKNLLWDTMINRTSNMMAYIYRTVADCFPEVKIEYEYNGLDAVLLRDNGDKIVALEHENDVADINVELNNFNNNDFPLNVLITYTGNRTKWILTPHSKLLNDIKGTVMFILPPEKQNFKEHKLGERLEWEYLIYDGNELKMIE